MKLIYGERSQNSGCLLGVMTGRGPEGDFCNAGDSDYISMVTL